jgi:hypothetical protein
MTLYVDGAIQPSSHEIRPMNLHDDVGLVIEPDTEHCPDPSPIEEDLFELSVQMLRAMRLEQPLDVVWVLGPEQDRLE